MKSVYFPEGRHYSLKEDFFRGVSKPVNEELAKLFIRLDLMEQTGYGIPLVTEKYGKDVFEFLDFFLRVTIPFAFEIEGEEQNVTQDSRKNVGVNVGVTEKHLLNLIAKNYHVTASSAAEALSISKRQAERLFSSLKEKGIIRRVGADKNGWWEVTE